MNRTKLPSENELAWGTFHVMRDLARPALIYEIDDRLAKFLHVSAKIRRIRHGRGPEFEFDFRAEWMRSKLQPLDVLYNSSRGEWALTKAGRVLRAGDKLHRKLVAKYGPDPFRSQSHSVPESISKPRGREIDRDWRQNLLNSIRKMNSNSFETLCQKFLNESGIERIDITKSTSGSGFEGTGFFRVNIISFRVFLGCWQSVDPIKLPEIISFRGTMVGRADKGLLVATSPFTESAQKEAARIDAPTIDLIDGISLCNHLRRMNIKI